MVTSGLKCVKLFFPFAHSNQESSTQMSQHPIIRSDDLRSENRRRLLDTLRSEGPCTPAQMADFTGLSAASISTLSSQLIDQGILLSERHPEENGKNARGRPRSQLSLNPEAGDAVTVNLTIDMIRAQRINYAGQVLQTHETAVKTRELTSGQVLGCAADAVDIVCPGDQQQQLHHIGVAFQGVTEHASGDLLWSPIIAHRHVPMGSTLQEKFNVPVSVDNDCRLISQALSQTQQDVLGNSFATVLFSHGIGLGLHLDGQPFAGTRSSALEIGHLRFEHQGALCRCGNRGCIEAYAADYGIERLANGQSVDDLPAGRVSSHAMQQLIEQAHQGERAAMQAFTIAGAAIGEGLVSLFTLLDPMPVALVGHSELAFSLMRGGMESTMRQRLGDDTDTAAFLHCYDSEHALLDQGLILNSLSQLDRLFSDPAIDIGISA